MEKKIEELRSVLDKVNFRMAERYGYDCLHCIHIEGEDECTIIQDTTESCNVCDAFIGSIDEFEIDKQYSKYIEGALKTETKDFDAIVRRFSKVARLNHAIMGIATEAGELLDAIKKYIYYGKEIDFANISEEIGDSHWYQAIAIDECEFKLSSILKTNLLKLAKRYGSKFSNDMAINRNLEEEKKILDKGLDGNKNG